MCTLIPGWICAGGVMAHTPCIQSVNDACSPEFPPSFLFYHVAVMYTFCRAASSPDLFLRLKFVFQLSQACLPPPWIQTDLFIFLTDLIPLLMSLKSHKWFTTIYTCPHKWWISGTMFKLYKWTSSLPQPPTHLWLHSSWSQAQNSCFSTYNAWHWEWFQSIKAWFHAQYHDLFSHKLGVIS